MAGIATIRLAAAAVVLLGLSGGLSSFEQAFESEPLNFELVSIKPSPLQKGMLNVVMRMSPPAFPVEPTSRYSSRFTTAQILIELAYGLKPHQVVGLPGWAQTEGRDTELYHVDAISPVEGPTREQLQEMLRSLLASRFALKSHKETRSVPIYTLAIAKGGVKFSSVKEPTRQSTTMFMFCQTVSRNLDRPLVDRTALEGHFEFPSSREMLRELRDSPSELAHALKERFGLELSPTKEESEVLVIDRLQHPSGN